MGKQQLLSHIVVYKRSGFVLTQCTIPGRTMLGHAPLQNFLLLLYLYGMTYHATTLLYVIPNFVYDDEAKEEKKR